jgi:hypothetical protein
MRDLATITLHVVVSPRAPNATVAGRPSLGRPQALRPSRALAPCACRVGGGPKRGIVRLNLEHRRTPCFGTTGGGRSGPRPLPHHARNRRARRQALLSGTTSPEAGSPLQNRPQSSISRRRFSNRSPRRYARSTRLATTCASAALADFPGAAAAGKAAYRPSLPEECGPPIRGGPGWERLRAASGLGGGCVGCSAGNQFAVNTAQRSGCSKAGRDNWPLRSILGEDSACNYPPNPGPNRRVLARSGELRRVVERSRGARGSRPGNWLSRAPNPRTTRLLDWPEQPSAGPH